jgi:hypothetical protein
MSIYYTTSKKISDIADAIRTKRQEDIQYTIDEMPDKILSISSGISVITNHKKPTGILVTKPSVIINTLTQ